MIMNRKKHILSVILIMVMGVAAFAQSAQNQFGKNRLQYKSFNWRYFSSDNFDIYFYDGGEATARIAAEFLEEEFERITDAIGYAPYSKTKIFLYNAIHDLQQSNVGVNDNPFTIGGQTNFVKSQVEVAYTGNMQTFKDELVLDISNMLINDMMFGGSLTDMFQSAYLLSLPSWFIKGAAHYIAKGWSIEMDDFMRDLFLTEKNIKLSKFSDEESALVGQSVWNFIAERYGKSSISNILNLTRIIRNEENSIVNTLGVPYKLFIKQWEDYYYEMALQVQENYTFPVRDHRLRKKNKKDYVYNKVRISPDGKFLAYSENYKGKYKVRIRNLQNGKDKTVHIGGYKVINQEIDYDVPLLSWRNNNVLGIIGTKRGQNHLWMYNRNNGRKQQKKLVKFNQVKDFSFNDNGRLAILSGDYSGKNDLFLYNPDRNVITRLSNDIYDDIHPKFIPGTDAIVFSSNRPNDSIIYTVNTKASEIELSEDINDNFNIFIYDLDATDTLLTRVTNTISRDINPVPKDESTIYYLSDQRGIYNIYKYNLYDSLFHQVSDQGISIKDYDVHFETGSIAYVMLSNGKDHVYHLKDYDLDKNIFTPKTQREQALQVKVISQRIAKNRQKNQQKDKEENTLGEQGQIVDFNGNVMSPVADSTQVGINQSDTLSIGQNLILDADSLLEVKDELAVTDTIPEQQPALPDDPDIIDTDNYVFDTSPNDIINTDNYTFSSDTSDINTRNYNFADGAEPRETSSNSFLSRYRRLQKETKIYGPLPYETRFSADNIVTSLAIDPLRGFGFLIEAQMNDMLENHKFYGGILAMTDLRSSTIFTEYQFLKNRIDYRARYQRDGVYLESSSDLTTHKYILNQFEVGASLPVNVTTRFELNPFYANTQFYDLNPNSIRPGAPPESESFFNYAGLKGGIVFDNTLVGGLNLYEGTRAKAMFTHYQGLDDAQKSFSNISVDIRNYQKIHREFIFASRLYYGTFFGNSPKKYLLGGMDNWLFNKTDRTREGDPLAINNNVDNSDILFVDYVPLRGFNYNKFNGNSVLTFTAELRFPVIRYFFRGPIASNFFRNLEFIGFYDVGSSWTGNSPFNEKNSLNTEIIEDGGPFRVELQNFKNPWLMSYGGGVRTVLLGYYLKFDIAYPIEDNIVGKPRFFLTLGYDF